MIKKKTIFFIFFLLLSVSLCSACKASDGWLTDYNYRKIFYWESNVDNAQEVLTVEYILNQTQSDFEDFRVTLNDGETLLSIWNQTTVNLEYCVFWCLFPIANTTYYLYWGNSEAEAIWNRTTVFNDVIENVAAAWPLNEALATDAVVDYSGNGNNGLATGTTIVTGVFSGENCREFSGTDEYVTVTNDVALQITGNLTVSFWVNPALEALNVPLSKNYQHEYDFYLGTDGAIVVDHGDGTEEYAGIFPSATLTASEWTHITFIRSMVASASDGYKNDTLVMDDYSFSKTPTTSTTDIKIGTRATDGIFDFKGKLAHIILFNATLTDTEAQNLSNYYVDCSLEEETALCRVWADSLISSWGETETYTALPEYSSEDILGVTIALIITFFSVALVLALVRRKRSD